MFLIRDISIKFPSDVRETRRRNSKLTEGEREESENIGIKLVGSDLILK